VVWFVLLDLKFNVLYIIVCIFWLLYCLSIDSRLLISSNFQVISHKWGNNRIMMTTNGTYLWSFVTQIFRNG
jgi:hypothetical protein